MIKYAITGNIASGKSEAERLLSKNNFIVFDTDIITHDILIDKPDVPELFKEYDIFEYGKLSRTKLSDLVFNNPELKKKLENTIHPLIKQELKGIFKTYSEEKYIFVSVPLLFEAGWEDMFDKIILITCDEKIQLERLMKRNNLSKTDALKRLKSQLPCGIKIPKADIIIENNSSIEIFQKKITDLIYSLK